ncbi:MAG: glycosyltransferase family 2 protein [Pirellulales bacterium]|nr:glycosyltransferase family 2 protein [Pirellulales bacterium]
MTLFAFVLFGLLMALVLGQAVLVLGFSRALRKQPPPLIGDQQAPPALVILCLRGADPYLSECLDGLLGQDYPQYDIRVIIDELGDPAHDVVVAKLQTCGAQNVTIEVLADKRETCSLKCSALLQAAANASEGYEFIAQIDADTLAHTTWLRELATALVDEKVGAATGNRWYMPSRATAGSLIRYTWNAAAIVQMYWYQVAWGGTLAIKTRVLRETNVLDKWGRAFCEDTMMFGVLKEAGLRTEFVPSLMMINREDCDLGGIFHWVSRQLLTARLYHPAWPAVLGHGVVASAAPAAAIATWCYAGWLGYSGAAAWAAVGLIGYELSLVVLLLPLELAVQKIAASRGQTSRWLSAGRMLKCLAIMPLTQLGYPVALGVACFMRTARWRGIDYSVAGPWDIKRHNYQPFRDSDGDDRVSL